MNPDVLSVTTTIILAMLAVAFVFTFVRLARGPSLPDRVIALDLVTTLAAGMIATYAIATDQSVFLDPAIVLAIISFLGTIAFAYYVERGASRQ